MEWNRILFKSTVYDGMEWKTISQNKIQKNLMEYYLVERQTMVWNILHPFSHNLHFYNIIKFHFPLFYLYLWHLLDLCQCHFMLNTNNRS